MEYILFEIYNKAKMKAKKVAAIFAAMMIVVQCVTVVHAEQPQDITATTWALVDVQTGQVLAQNLGSQRMYPASITKILVIAMALEKSQGDTSIQLTVSNDAVHSITFDSSHIALQVGEVVSLADMLYGAMLASGNDAANVLAEYVCGSLQNVEDVFSQKLAQLGCENTHFINAHGLHNENHYTTAEDMAKITRWALSVPGFQEVFNSQRYDMPPTNLQPEVRHFSTPDWMRLNGIKYHYEYAIGSKNGWTTEAGHTFASWAEKDGRQLICVLMNSATKYKKFVDAANLYEYGFRDFTPVDVTEILPTTDIVIQGGGDPLGNAELKIKPITLYLPEGYTTDSIKSEIKSPEVFVLGQPFHATIKVWLETPEKEKIALGEFPMEVHGIDTVLSANVGLRPQNLVGSGRENYFDPQMVLVYAAIFLTVGVCVIGAWKLGKKHSQQLRRADWIGSLRKNKKRWRYGSVETPQYFKWRVTKNSKYPKIQSYDKKYVFRNTKRR